MLSLPLDEVMKNLVRYVAELGDSFAIEGVRVRLVSFRDYETIKISGA
jgi:hypothetical protein